MKRRTSSPWLFVLLMLGVVPAALAQGEAAGGSAPATLDVVAAARGVVGPPKGPARSGAASMLSGAATTTVNATNTMTRRRSRPAAASMGPGTIAPPDAGVESA